ncbi:unnamed protein product [Ectocarpus sp. 12 AP-2014]
MNKKGVTSRTLQQPKEERWLSIIVIKGFVFGGQQGVQGLVWLDTMTRKQDHRRIHWLSPPGTDGQPYPPSLVTLRGKSQRTQTGLDRQHTNSKLPPWAHAGVSNVTSKYMNNHHVTGNGIPACQLVQSPSTLACPKTQWRREHALETFQLLYNMNKIQPERL